jgi:DNA-binding MurR/RpiR family transcriptional regulator
MQSVTTYMELRELIARAYPDMSKQLQCIARFSLGQPNDLARGTVASVAAACEVQPSAVIRFANALGYTGFSELQHVFLGYLLEHSGSYRERIEKMRKQQVGDAKAAPLDLLHHQVGECIAELSYLEEGNLQAELKIASKLIARAPRVYVLAQRRAFPVAAYLAYALSQLELRSHLLIGAGGMLSESLRNIDPGDVLIAASFRNYSPEVMAAAVAASHRGIDVVAITDGALSPLKASVKVCLELADDSSKPFRSLVAPLCVAQALVVGVGHQLAEKPVKNTKPKRVTARQKETL